MVHESILGDNCLVMPAKDLAMLFAVHNDMELRIVVLSSPAVVVFVNGQFKYKYFYMDNELYTSIRGETPFDIEGEWVVIAGELDRLRTFVEVYKEGVMDIDLGEDSILFQIGGISGSYNYYELEVVAESVWKEISE
jgi:hypothetical protein